MSGFWRRLGFNLSGIALGMALCTSCAGLPGDAPGPCHRGQLRVSSDGQVLNWVEGPKPGADPAATRQQTLTRLAQSHDVTASLYVPIGARIDVAVGDGITSAVVQDTPIAADGTARWSGWQDVPASSNGAGLAFVVPQNVAGMLSSDSADYAPRSSIRGVVLTIGCAAGTQQYGFAIRTDPPASGLFDRPPA